MMDTTPSDDPRIAGLNQKGFNHKIDLQVIRWSQTDCLVALDIAAHHLNPAGLVHGGVYSTMLDVALAMTGSYVPPPLVLMPGLTLNLNLQFIQTASVGDVRLYASGRKTGGGKSIFFATGEVCTRAGRLVASATGVFKPGRQPVP